MYTFIQTQTSFLRSGIRKFLKIISLGFSIFYEFPTIKMGLFKPGKHILRAAACVLVAAEEHLSVPRLPGVTDPLRSPRFHRVKTEVCSGGDRAHHWTRIDGGLGLLMPGPLPLLTPTCAGRVHTALPSPLPSGGPAFQAAPWLASGNLALGLFLPLPN